MPPTVKSLEERIDDLADDFGEVKSQLAASIARIDMMSAQLAGVLNALATQQAQFAAANAKLDAVADGLKATNARLDAVIQQSEARTATVVQQFEARTTAIMDKLDAQAAALAEFRGEAKAVFGLLRWFGATAVLALMAFAGGAITMSRSVGHLDGTVQQLAKTTHEIKRDVDDIRAKLKP